MRAQDQLQLGVDPSQGAELEKVDLEVSVGVYTLHDPLDLGLAVRKSLGAHEFGEAGLAHAALALVFQVYMSVKLSTEARVVEAAEHQHQRVRNLRWRRGVESSRSRGAMLLLQRQHLPSQHSLVCVDALRTGRSAGGGKLLLKRAQLLLQRAPLCCRRLLQARHTSAHLLGQMAHQIELPQHGGEVRGSRRH